MGKGMLNGLQLNWGFEMKDWIPANSLMICMQPLLNVKQCAKKERVIMASSMKLAQTHK
jgi:hypothetical protein